MIHTVSQHALEQHAGPVEGCDSLLAVKVPGFPLPLAPWYKRRLDLDFQPVEEDCGDLKAPRLEDTIKVLDFAKEAKGLIVSCGTGVYVGRAIRAALEPGNEADRFSGHRGLLRLLKQAQGQPIVEPLVSVIVNLGHVPECGLAFALPTEVNDESVAGGTSVMETVPPILMVAESTPAPPDPGILARRQARAVLGFAATEPLTIALLRDRKRVLAKRHHPDHGGSVSKMAEVNSAADVLEQAIEAGIAV